MLVLTVGLFGIGRVLGHGAVALAILPAVLTAIGLIEVHIGREFGDHATYRRWFWNLWA